MTRTFTIGASLIIALVLGCLPARAEYMRDERGAFSSDVSSAERAGKRTSARASQRAARSASRPSRPVARSARARDDGIRPQRRTAQRTGAPLRSLTGGSHQSGIASYYWQPQRVASGGWFNPNAMTAAHKTLPFGTRVRVTSQATGRSVVVTINDRGPYIRGRIIDLSRAAAGVIGMRGSGIARVQVAVLGR